MILIIMALISPGLSGSDAAEKRAAKYVRGGITNVNFAGSRVTIKWFYSTDKVPSNDRMTFRVPDNVQVLSNKRKIFEETRPAAFTDLIVGDHVVIKYFEDDKSGDLEAAGITILDHDRPIPP